MEKRAMEMIRDLSNANGVSGFEDEVLETVRRYAPEHLNLSEDHMRNLYLRRPEGGEGKPVVLLDAHSDEVGFMVQAIRPNGTLKFIPLGGWVPCNIPAHRVRVQSRGGDWITGIIASRPPHFMTAAEKERVPDIAEMSIDVGACSAEEARNGFGIRVGAPVVPDVDFSYDEKHGLMLGKAFDNRLGCAAMLALLSGIGTEPLGVDVVGAIASQEEVGTRGASVTARTVQPDAAIVFEGCPADDTVAEPWLSQTGLRRGPMLRHIDARMITNPRFQRFALDLAEKEGIPVQEAVRTGGSTNGAPIHLSGDGVPTIVIGIPVRYIHTHYGFAAPEDLENAVALAEAVLRHLDRETIAGF